MERFEGSINDNASAESPQAFYVRTPNSSSIKKDVFKFFTMYKEDKPQTGGQHRREKPNPRIRLAQFQLTNCFGISKPGAFESEILKFSPVIVPTQRQYDFDTCLSHVSLPTSLIFFSKKELPVRNASLIELCASLNSIIEANELTIVPFEPEEFQSDHESGLSELHDDCSLMSWMILTPCRNSNSGGSVADTYFGHAIALRLLRTDNITRQMIKANPLLCRIRQFTMEQRKYYNNDDYQHHHYSFMASQGSFEASVLELVGFEFNPEIHKEDVREGIVNTIRKKDDNNGGGGDSSLLFDSLFPK
jgi:hypothetical protein